jgi:hypothetical protein
VNNGPLVRRKLIERAGQGIAKSLFIRIGRRGKDVARFGGQLIVTPFARAVAADSVDGGVVRQTQKKDAFAPDAVQHLRSAGQFDEHVLQYIARFRFVAGQVDQESEEGRRVFVVKAFKIERRHVVKR